MVAFGIDGFPGAADGSVRSFYARFDPRLAHLSNLNAGIAPAGVAMGALAAMPASDKDEIKKYLGMIY